MRTRTVNQINSFAQRNTTLAHYERWKENINRLNPLWRNELTDEKRRGLDRKTFRGNCIYGNLLKTVAAYSGIDISEYNYYRDNLVFNLDVTWRVSLDAEGVWIEASLPWKQDENPYSKTTYIKKRLRADVPFDAKQLKSIVERYNNKYFFPENTLVGTIQRRRLISKAKAVCLLKERIKAKSDIFELDIDDFFVQKSIKRQLKKRYNLLLTVHIDRGELKELIKYPASKQAKRVERFDVGQYENFDGDIDELESEFYASLSDVVYLDARH